jgi:glycosyltransferase involved in cell wall biosynthesis
MTTYILRASHANAFELQNYYPLAKKLDLCVITSHHPLTPVSLPAVPLWSPTDLPPFPFRKQILNRTIGGEQWLFGLEQVIKPGSVVHTAETYTPYTHQAVELRRRGVISKLICTCWETIPHANEKFARLRRWKSDVYHYVDIFHTPTLRAKQALIAEGVPARKIKVIPYGVDFTRFHPTKTKSKLSKPIILMVARPVREKGIQIFRQLVHELDSLADFRLVSSASYQDMPAIYRQADIFFFPSQTTSTWEEQYGMSLVEAMASGLPIVTTTSGAIPEIVGPVALISAPHDHQALLTNLTKLIADPALRAKLSRRSLVRARRLYDSRRVSRGLVELYR